jgi:23S rRNA (cytosine1962-C5)-methyltransferase
LIKIILGPRAIKKINQNTYELFLSDFEQSLKQFTPGQWCCFFDERKKTTYFGYVNPHVENNRPCAYIVKKNNIAANEDPFEYIKLQINRAVSKRESLYEYGTNARLVYGGADYLPGLIIDSYMNCLLVQINTAGMDQFRIQIKDFLKESLKKEVIFLDNKAYRAGEFLPEFNEAVLDHDIEVVENEVNYKIRAAVMQKIGYYYDHRINREKARKLSHRIKTRKLKGLDLFCYVGSWGLNLLNGNVSDVDFVDQGDFETEINENLKLNNKENQGEFFRKDAFNENFFTFSNTWQSALCLKMYLNF